MKHKRQNYYVERVCEQQFGWKGLKDGEKMSIFNIKKLGSTELRQRELQVFQHGLSLSNWFVVP